MHKQLDTTGHDFAIWQVDNTVNGAERYVVHYLAIPFTDDPDQPYHVNQSNHIEAARKALYGKKYRAKWFGGGIVFQAYAGDPVKHVLAAIKSAETGASFTDTFKSLNK